MRERSHKTQDKRKRESEYNCNSYTQKFRRQIKT